LAGNRRRTGVADDRIDCAGRECSSAKIAKEEKRPAADAHAFGSKAIGVACVTIQLEEIGRIRFEGYSLLNLQPAKTSKIGTGREEGAPPASIAEGDFASDDPVATERACRNCDRTWPGAGAIRVLKDLQVAASNSRASSVGV